MDVGVSSVKAGVANTSGNKGAVMVRFQLEDTSFVFVNNHLCSGATKSNEYDRAQMLEYIINQGYKGERGTQYQNYEVLNHDVKVFFGDLNFRIDMPRSDVVKAIRDKNYTALMRKDELYRTGMSHPILKNCKEGQLLFDPTYKYDYGKLTYESTKQRTPSWTDRVLFS